MQAFNNLKTGVKLIGGFLAVVVITIIVGVVGITQLRAIDAADTWLYENMTVPLGELVDITTTYQRMRVNLRDLLLAETAADGLPVF